MTPVAGPWAGPMHLAGSSLGRRRSARIAGSQPLFERLSRYVMSRRSTFARSCQVAKDESVAPPALLPGLPRFSHRRSDHGFWPIGGRGEGGVPPLWLSHRAPPGRFLTVERCSRSFQTRAMVSVIAREYQWGEAAFDGSPTGEPLRRRHCRATISPPCTFHQARALETSGGFGDNAKDCRQARVGGYWMPRKPCTGVLVRMLVPKIARRELHRPTPDGSRGCA